MFAGSVPKRLKIRQTVSNRSSTLVSEGYSGHELFEKSFSDPEHAFLGATIIQHGKKL
jgi:hypothetical protein